VDQVAIAHATQILLGAALTANVTNTAAIAAPAQATQFPASTPTHATTPVANYFIIFFPKKKFGAKRQFIEAVRRER